MWFLTLKKIRITYCGPKRNLPNLSPKSQHTATKIPFMYSFSGNCEASVPIFTFICLWAIYICVPGISPHIFLQQNLQIDRGHIWDTWMWKLGLWPRNSFPWNICIEFSVLFLCSALPHTLVTKLYIQQQYKECVRKCEMWNFQVFLNFVFKKDLFVKLPSKI